MDLISVKKELPIPNKKVLFVTKDKNVYVGCKCDLKNCKDFHYNSTGFEPNGISNVTHWIYIKDLNLIF